MGAYLSTLRPTASLSTSESRPSSPTSNHYPSKEDVFLTRAFMLGRLPLELVDIILDLAMYWPRVVARETRRVEVNASAQNGHDANFVYLVTPPIPPSPLTEGRGQDGRIKVNLVRFSLCSRDQGWGGEAQLTGKFSRC